MIFIQPTRSATIEILQKVVVQQTTCKQICMEPVTPKQSQPSHSLKKTFRL